LALYPRNPERAIRRLAGLGWAGRLLFRFLYFFTLRAKFWENFFLCAYNYCKQGYAVIYILTRQQLVLLQDWWNKMMAGSNQAVKDNLNKSKIEFFGSYPVSAKLNGKPVVLDPLYVYYVDNIVSSRTKHLRLKRLVFDKSKSSEKVPSSKGIEFFEENISADNVQEIAIPDRTGVLGRVFSSLKEKVASEIGNNIFRQYKFEGEWPYYLSSMDYGHRWIKYCQEIKPKCPLVEEYFTSG
jgi:hypothetical protein